MIYGLTSKDCKPGREVVCEAKTRGGKVYEVLDGARAGANGFGACVQPYRRDGFPKDSVGLGTGFATIEEAKAACEAHAAA
jgi:hypothetical protein